MESVDGEYSMYWETKRFFDCEELRSWGLDEAFSGCCSYESISPERPLSPSTATKASKNVVMERNRRKRLNETLYSLRSVVPNITKMDKSSVIKDAISYVQQLQEQERQMAAEETSELISAQRDHRHRQDNAIPQRSTKKKRDDAAIRASSFEVSELRVRAVDEKTLGVSMSCKKKRGTMIMLCELFKSLNLKTITASVTCVAEEIFHTLLVEVEDMDSAQLKEKIEIAIAEFNGQ